MAGPVVILDFDGVINMLGSGRAARRKPGVLGHVVRAELECDGMVYQVRYSREVVRRLATAVCESGAELWWLTTWNACTASAIEPELGLQSAGWIAWDPTRAATPPEAKYAALVARFGAGSRPLVWVDDEAADLLDVSDFPELGVAELLAIAPDASVGLLQADLARVEAFLGGIPPAENWRGTDPVVGPR